MKIMIKKLRRLDNPLKTIVSIGVPILMILLVAGTTNYITDELDIGSSFGGIDPFEIEESWWIWFVTILFIMAFEWMLFSRDNEEHSGFERDTVNPNYSNIIENNKRIKKVTTIISAGNHPWRRYFARIVDVSIIGNILLILLFVIIGLISPKMLGDINNLDQGEQIIVSTMLLFALWVPIEVMSLCVIGTTPAKWIFGISVTSVDGKKIKFSQALSRSVSVWARGLCFGIPPLSIFSMLFALNKLKLRGQTYWDETYHTKITHRVWGAGRAIFSFLSVLVAVLFVAILKNL